MDQLNQLGRGHPVDSDERQLRILVVHNAYQRRGGEEEVRDGEVSLLRQHGQIVETYDRESVEIEAMSRISVTQQTFWSLRTTADLRERIGRFRPDVIHVHNSFPLISPSIFWGAARARVPVVQTLHNFRLLCPQAMFLRDGKVCEDCLGKVPWRSVAHKCYHESAAQSAVVTTMLSAHRLAGTYRKKINRYIALSGFCRSKFIAGGFPADLISVKSNFVDVPASPDGPRKGALFVGRLSHEKGVTVMLDALNCLGHQSIDVIGSGPLQTMVAEHPQVNSLGSQPRSEVLRRMQRAEYLLVPSIWHEGPMTVIEAFACGLPVIASRSGAMEELIEDGVTGLLFDAGSPTALLSAIRWANEHPAMMREMGANARSEYLRRYTPELNYRQLMSIYGAVLPSCS